LGLREGNLSFSVGGLSLRVGFLSIFLLLDKSTAKVFPLFLHHG
jgi:hypothetical protein